MRILKIKTLYNGICDYVGCYNSRPGTYPPPETSNPALIYNNDPDIYATQSGSGTKFYNSAVYKNISNHTAYVVVITATSGLVCEYINSGGFYNTTYPTNYITGTPSRTFMVESADNFATFETELPVFTDYNEFLNYVTNLQNPPVVYQWSSVRAINGKLGNFSLSMIKNTELGDGLPVTGAGMGVIDRLEPSTSFRSLMSTAGVGLGNVTLMYSGNTKRLDAEFLYLPLLGQVVQLYFYLAPSTGGVQNLIYAEQFAISDASNTYLGFIKDDENEVASLSIIRTYKENQVEYVSYNEPGASLTAEEMHDLWVWLQGGTSDDDTDGIDNFTDNEPNGGGGSIQRFNNPVPKPGQPGKSAVATGFVSLWYMTDAQLQSLANYLWSDDFIDIIEKRLYTDPKDAIVNLMIMPYEPDHDNADSYIFVCGRNTTKQGKRITGQWTTKSMGKITVPRLLENGVYFDYPPYTSCRLFLPFCGEPDIDVNDIMGKTIELEYLIDNLSGVCVANLNILDPENDDETKGDHYYFSGQMGIKIPVSASDFSGVYGALLSAGATIGSALATSASGGMTAPLAMGVVANAGANIANMTPNYQYSSGGGAISGALGGEYPFLLISEPKCFEAVNQRKYIGYPSLSTYYLNEMSGFVKVHDIHIDGVICSEFERDQIRTQLLGGVIIQTGTTITTEDITPTDEDDTVLLFLKNMSDKNTIGKIFATVDDEIDGALIEGKLLVDQSIERPTLIIEGNMSDYNYVYIPEFKRYYYITDIDYKAGGIQYIHCEVDPLQSFKDSILDCQAIIADCEEANKAKLLCNNNSWFMEQDKNVITLMFKDEYNRPVGFVRGASSDESYVLALAGDGTP